MARRTDVAWEDRRLGLRLLPQLPPPGHLGTGLLQVPAGEGARRPDLPGDRQRHRVGLPHPAAVPEGRVGAVRRHRAPARRPAGRAGPAAQLLRGRQHGAPRAAVGRPAGLAHGRRPSRGPAAVVNSLKVLVQTAVIRRLYGDYTASIRRLYGGYAAAIRRIYGGRCEKARANIE